jgi:histidinol-phosphatase
VTLADDLALALRLADAADAITGPAFTGEALAHRIKPDGSPVSDTDEAVELRIREIVADERPADGVLGEEVGASGPGGRRWIVDGIDGTVLFVAGVRGWSTQIALEVDGEPVIGVTTSGADGKRWWAARGAGAWHAVGDGPTELLRVSDRTSLAGGGAGADPGAGTGHGAGAGAGTGTDRDGRYTLIPPLDALAPARRAAVDVAAAGVDAIYVPPREHGALYVADGRVEVCVQLGGGAWDFAALAVIVAEAGGRFSDLAGRRDIYGGGPVVFSNGLVHDEVLALLADRT